MYSCPLRIKNPEFACAATSGTHRELPCGTPVPRCQLGRGKMALEPPPPPTVPFEPGSLDVNHAASPLGVQLGLKARAVPPTAVRFASEAGYSTAKGYDAL